MIRQSLLVVSLFAAIYTHSANAAVYVPNSVGAMVINFGPTYAKVPSQVRNARWNPDVLESVGSSVAVKQYPIVPIGNASANVSLGGIISPTTALGVLGAVLGGPAGVAISVALAIPSVVDFLSKAQISPSGDTSNPLQVKKAPEPSSDGYQYSYQRSPYSDLPRTCEYVAEYGSHAPGDYGFEWSVISSNAKGGSAYCEISVKFRNSAGTVTDRGTSTIGNFDIRQVSTCPLGQTGTPPNCVPASDHKPISWSDAVPLLSGQPVSPQLIQDLVAAGYSFPFDNQTISGPAAVAVAPTVTTIQSTNAAKDSITTTTTATPTTSITYDNSNSSTGPTATATTTTTTTTNVYNNTTNTTINNSSTSATTPISPPDSSPAPLPPKATDPVDLSFTDPALDPLPKLYEPKYPDGMVGVWDKGIQSIKATPLFSLVSSLMPTNIGASGTCPSWMLNLSFAKLGDFGTKDVAPPCWVWDFGKVVITISALLLARSLIFGG